MTISYHCTEFKHPRACKAILSIKTDCNTSPEQILATNSVSRVDPTRTNLPRLAVTEIAHPALAMAATSVQNPPTQSESKSSKKKKAKAAAAATERTESPAPAATPDQPASVAGNNDISENAYIRELKK